VASAAASDLPIYSKAPVALYDWTGFYVGGNGGYASARLFADTGQT
jgi:hypothetical protein